MTLLITGGTGKVGSALARRAGETGLPAALMSRTAPQGAAPGAPPWRAGDYERPESLKRAFEGVETLFLVAPVDENETELALRAIEVAKAQGVARLIHLSIMNLEAMARIPHFATKIPIEAAVEASGLDWAILRANFFFQNDLMFLPAILFGGIYPMPLGSKGLMGVDVRDIAEAALRLAQSARLGGRRIPLSGRDPLTGPGNAAAWSAALGRPVAYVGDDLDAFSAMIEQQMGGLSPWLKADLRIMMEENQAQGCPATEAQLAEAEAAVGAPLRRYGDFVREAAAPHAAA